MGIIKRIIERFRASGKTENEISSIIEEAADKASVNRDALKKKEYKKPEITVTTSAEEFVEAVMRMGVTMEQAKTAILKPKLGERLGTFSPKRLFCPPFSLFSEATPA